MPLLSTNHADSMALAHIWTAQMAPTELPYFDEKVDAKVGIKTQSSGGNY
jgi:hypothetical protein